MDAFIPAFLRNMPSKKRRKLENALFCAVVFIVVAPMIIFALGSAPACGGGYPDKWCKQDLDSVVDDWGMYNRECVSYTAYRVAASGRSMPYGFGDANQWPEKARAYGIAVDNMPRVGDVAIKSDTQRGHSMYVEAINSDGKLVVSQYNTDKIGTYSKETIAPNSLEFIHF